MPMPMLNINPETGIAYGYISANALDPEIVDQLQNGTDVNYEAALEEAMGEVAQRQDVQLEALSARGFDPAKQEVYSVALEHVKENWNGSDWEQAFNDSYQPDEPVHEGEIGVGVPGHGVSGVVKYRTSWLGGALNVFIFESPFTTDKARRASPCVPNAGILDVLDGDVTAYDVPADWRKGD